VRRGGVVFAVALCHLDDGKIKIIINMIVWVLARRIIKRQGAPGDWQVFDGVTNRCSVYGGWWSERNWY